MDCYRDRIHNYVDQTRQHQWPPTTAEFVLLSYPRLLREHSDTARLTMLATDLVRHERLWKTTGTDTEALTEISDALALHRASSETDLVACVRLAYCRKRLLDKAAMTPNSVIVAWAALGLVHRAVALAVLCREHHRLGVICSGILRAAPDPIHGDLLVAAVSDLPDQASRMAAWQACVSAFALNGRGGKAVDLARAITDPQRQVSALGTIAKAMAGAGRTEETTALLDQAVELARTITNPQQQASALGTISEAMASTGRAEEAVELARTITDPERQAFALSTVTEAMADAGRTEETTALLDQAVELARTITDPMWQTFALSTITEAMTGVGRTEEAVELARTITDPAWQASTVSPVAKVLVREGRTEEAVELARTITDPQGQASTLGTIAEAMADAGRAEEAVALLDQAVELARTITDPQQQASALAALA
ncbi:tetratricopeptide repeat protein, partial [Streptomyces prasinus]|uniref:tetratricopeptide repeat protein n=1 Tax=Streptomyces prasinus TaxID=67345 RepID=UPI0033C99C6D